MNMFHRFGFKELVYAFACVAVLMMGIGAFFYINHSTNTREYERLVRDAQTIASLIEPTRIESLSLSEADLMNPDYQRLKKQMMDARAVNPDLRFVYLMAKRDNEVFFVVDSEDPESEDYSPPGQKYDEASEELLAGWNPEMAFVLEIYEDRWGNWISALAPIKNATGTTVALLGLDQNADAHRLVFLTEAGLVALATLALLSLVSMSYILSKREEDLINMKADFVAVASHELRTPLMSLRWELAQLKADSSLTNTVRTALHTMYDQVCMLIDLSTSFLMTTSADHGMMSTKNFKPFDVASLVHSRIVNATPGAALRSITIASNITPSTHATIVGDEDRLRLVFDNLISNAVKYSPANTTVSVNYTETDTAQQFVVSDQGIGIPESDIASIFRGFNRATNAQKAGVSGTGFGLYITKRIIDFHNGTIICTSKEGSGTTFTVSFPRV